MEVREATLEDVPGIGVVHAEAWRAAYAGLMPQEFLDGFTPEARAARWQKILAEAHAPAWRLFVSTRGTEVTGFACVGPARRAEDAAAGAGELMVLNVHPAHWGTGSGQALHDAAVDSLRASGFRDAMLLVVEQNARARRFYERNGWRDSHVPCEIQVGGAKIRECRYVRAI